MNVGSGEGLDAAGLTAMLEGLGAPAGKVQRVDLKQTYSYAFVAEEDARGVREARRTEARREDAASPGAREATMSERPTAEALRAVPLLSGLTEAERAEVAGLAEAEVARGAAAAVPRREIRVTRW